MACRFYGKSQLRGELISIGESNRCGKITQAHSPCGMEMVGRKPDEEVCPLAIGVLTIEVKVLRPPLWARIAERIQRLCILIDCAILAVIEPLSHRIQIATGWDAIDQRRVCYVGSAGAMLKIAIDAVKFPLWLAIPSFMAGMFGAGLYLWISKTTTRIDEVVRTGDTPNPRRFHPFGYIARTFMTIMLILAMPINTWSGRILWFTLWLAWVLDAVQPLPPSRGKWREWFKRPVEVKCHS